MSLVYAIVLADCIEDCDILRTGRTGSLPAISPPPMPRIDSVLIVPLSTLD